MGENPSSEIEGDLPVSNISFRDCLDFLQKLNAMQQVKNSEFQYRLPTKREWLYACRAGATGEYCKLANGDEITRQSLGVVAWYEENSNNRPHPVGQKAPNAFGLYDMLGNMEEWLQPEDGFFIRVRGSFDWPDYECRSNNIVSWGNTHRSDHGNGDYGNGCLGFRLAADKVSK